VLLLEAGPDYRSNEAPPEMRSPNFLEIVLRGGYHWPALYARLTETQEPKLYLQGRGVGGGSAINALGAVRGIPADFETWAEQGCTGWSWQDVLPFFIHLEEDLDFGDLPYHGKAGPIPVGRPPPDRWGAVARAFVEAALALGHPWREDANAPEASPGVSPGPRTIRDGVRVSTNDAYLEPARARPNLTILGHALVDRVQFDGARAVGVRLWTPDGPILPEAGEVILCAGAIHSPAILMRSGIGRSNELRSLGITPVVDLAGVGENLGEHPLVRVKLALRPEARAASLRTNPFGCGLRASSGAAGANDLTLFPADIGASFSEGAIWVGVAQSFSRGRVTIRSPDPNVEPWVEFRLLTDDRDLQRMREGVRVALRLGEHRAFSALSEGVFAPGLPAEGLSDPSLDDWLRANCEEHAHALGTCRMGPADDPRSVVDPSCRVIGVEGLRVADSSIMPEPPRAPTHLTTVMIAEHLAQRLRHPDP
jgi:choline dehydrogenase